MSFNILNGYGDVQITIEAESINDAMIVVQDMIKKDGSYRNDLKVIECQVTGQRKYLK